MANENDTTPKTVNEQPAQPAEPAANEPAHRDAIWPPPGVPEHQDRAPLAATETENDDEEAAKPSNHAVLKVIAAAILLAILALIVAAVYYGFRGTSQATPPSGNVPAAAASAAPVAPNASVQPVTVVPAVTGVDAQKCAGQWRVEEPAHKLVFVGDCWKPVFAK